MLSDIYIEYMYIAFHYMYIILVTKEEVQQRFLINLKFIKEMSCLKSLRYKFVISAVVGEKKNEDYLKMQIKDGSL